MPGNEDQKENFTKIKQDLNTSLNSYNLKSLSLEFANSLFKGFILSVIITFFFTIRKSKI
jgi:type III secretory pathway component EscU